MGQCCLFFWKNNSNENNYDKYANRINSTSILDIFDRMNENCSDDSTESDNTSIYEYNELFCEKSNYDFESNSNYPKESNKSFFHFAKIFCICL